MNLKTYIIEYTVYGRDGLVLKTGTMRAKRKATAFEAQCKFELYLKGKYPQFSRLVVHECKEDFDLFDLSVFSDMFGGL